MLVCVLGLAAARKLLSYVRRLHMSNLLTQGANSDPMLESNPKMQPATGGAWATVAEGVPDSRRPVAFCSLGERSILQV